MLRPAPDGFLRFHESVSGNPLIQFAVPWTFFSNHGHVLLYLDAHPDPPLREVAVAIGITERSAQKIISELVEAGYVSRERDGRRNRYTVNPDVPLRHSQLVGHSVGELLSGLDPNQRNPQRCNGKSRTLDTGPSVERPQQA